MPGTIPIDDPADPRLADYVELTDPAARRRRERDEIFITEGVTAIERLLDSGHVVRSVLLTPKHHAALRPRLEQLDAPVYMASQPVLAATVGFDLHRGAVAAAERQPLPAGRRGAADGPNGRRARGTERPREPRCHRPLGPGARRRRPRARPDVHRPVLPAHRAGQHGRGAASARRPRRVMAGRPRRCARSGIRDLGTDARSCRRRPVRTGGARPGGGAAGSGGSRAQPRGARHRRSSRPHPDRSAASTR